MTIVRTAENNKVICNILIFMLPYNACHNELGEMGTFLRLFAKKLTSYPIQLAGTC